MPTDRAGYTLSVYAIDVSPSMGEPGEDPDGGKGKGKGKTKLDLVKEFVARRCEPKISSGRKTEAVGILSFGGKTNNQAHRAYIAQNPEDEDPPYADVACDVAIQTAKPKTVEVVMNLDVGEHEGNPVSALMVALDMIHTHKHTKSWALEVVLITDGESAFKQDEYEDAMARLDELGVRLSVVGIGFEPIDRPVDKSKSRDKRLAEKFWRTFVQMLYEQVSQTTQSEEMLPTIETFEDALSAARRPRAAVVNGTVSGIDLYIGSSEIDPEQAIRIPIKYSKATMKARPPSLSKAWKPAMDLQAPLQSKTGGAPSASQLMSSIAQQSQSAHGPSAGDLAAMISADVKHHSAYVIKRPVGEEGGKETQTQASQAPNYGLEGLDEEYNEEPQEPEAEQEEEEVVAKEDIVKAWRYGSTWVPMEADTFEPLDTRKSVEVLGFFPQENIKRHHLMGEVRYIWPDLTSPKAQIQFSSLVEGMHLRGMCAVVRWVLKDRAEPVVGLCVPDFSYPGEEKRLDFMFWVKLPFAEDEHNFWFPSLTTYKTSSGKVITDHPLLPTDEQCEAMDELVEAMDLDAYAREQHKPNGEDDEMDGEELEQVTWFDPINSFNPVIHRIKEAIFHASLTQDLDADPLGPPHPELVKFFKTPEGLGERVQGVTQRLKEKLDIKKVPPRVRAAKKTKEGLRPDEGYIDIDEFFENGEAGGETTKTTKTEPETPRKGVKKEPSSPEVDQHDAPSPTQKTTPAKPKRGRLISNENPIEDFDRLIEGEGDVFRKALQDMGAVVRENVAASFSRQAFPLAIECLKKMREVALMYEEVETYNEYVDELEKHVKDPGFKHKDFWKSVEKAGQDVGKISPEEAQAALEGYE